MNFKTFIFFYGTLGFSVINNIYSMNYNCHNKVNEKQLQESGNKHSSDWKQGSSTMYHVNESYYGNDRSQIDNSCGDIFSNQQQNFDNLFRPIKNGQKFVSKHCEKQSRDSSRNESSYRDQESNREISDLSSRQIFMNKVNTKHGRNLDHLKSESMVGGTHVMIAFKDKKDKKNKKKNINQEYKNNNFTLEMITPDFNLEKIDEVLHKSLINSNELKTIEIFPLMGKLICEENLKQYISIVLKEIMILNMNNFTKTSGQTNSQQFSFYAQHIESVINNINKILYIFYQIFTKNKDKIFLKKNFSIFNQVRNEDLKEKIFNMIHLIDLDIMHTKNNYKDNSLKITTEIKNILFNGDYTSHDFFLDNNFIVSVLLNKLYILIKFIRSSLINFKEFIAKKINISRDKIKLSDEVFMADCCSYKHKKTYIARILLTEEYFMNEIKKEHNQIKQFKYPLIKNEYGIPTSFDFNQHLLENTYDNPKDDQSSNSQSELIDSKEKKTTTVFNCLQITCQTILCCFKQK